MEQVKKQRQVNKTVRGLYAIDKGLINSDKLLLVRYWNRLGLDLTREQIAKFMSIPSAESITRSARLIRSEMPLEAVDKDVLKARENQQRMFWGINKLKRWFK